MIVFKEVKIDIWTLRDLTGRINGGAARHITAPWVGSGSLATEYIAAAAQMLGRSFTWTGVVPRLMGYNCALIFCGVPTRKVGDGARWGGGAGRADLLDRDLVPC